MEAAQRTFISSTFWTERIGPTAALATLKVMEEIESWEIITAYGNKMRDGWKSLADSNNLLISISGIPSLSTYSFNTSNNLIYKTFISQEMLKKGYLASTNFYPSTAHNNTLINTYLEDLNEVFSVISKCENGEIDLNNILEGPVCHGGFKRLN
jgi:glutamate-1-semialdehyde aminotransferase